LTVAGSQTGKPLSTMMRQPFVPVFPEACWAGLEVREKTFFARAYWID
jgi:hypothetical protein